MSILLDDTMKVVVQGITGREGAFHAQQMIDYGTNVVAGVTPGKGGEWAVGNTPVFDTVAEAVEAAAQRKVDGQEIVAPEAPQPTGVVDLMDALKASVEATKAKKAG